MTYATLSIVTNLIREAAHPLTGSGGDYDSLLEMIAATHR